MDTTRHFQLLQLLDGLTADDWLADADNLRYRLAPIIAKTADEQRRFYAFFDQLEADWAQEAADRKTAIPRSRGRIFEKGSGMKGIKNTTLVFILLTLATLALAFATWLLFSPAKEKITFDLAIAKEDLPPVLQQGDTLIVNIASERPDSTGFIWQIQAENTGKIQAKQQSEQLNWIIDQPPGSYRLILTAPTNSSVNYQPLADTLSVDIQCTDPPTAVQVSPSSAQMTSLTTDSLITFSIDDLPEGITAQWTFSSPYYQTTGPQASHRFAGLGGEGGYSLRLTNEQNPAYCYSIQEDYFRLGNNNAFMPLVTFQKDETPHIISKTSWLYWFLALFPLMPAFLLYLLWRNALRKQEADKLALDAASDLPVHDAAPYFIPYLEQEEKIKVPPDFFRIARILRRREEGQRRTFAAKATISATVKAGGYPSWRDKALTRPAEYLVLLPSREEGHQQDKLLLRLVQFMQRRDAPLIAYYHDSGFRNCWQPGTEKTITLPQLFQRYPAHRLLILGNAHELVNPHASRQPALLKTTIRQLTAWPRRLLLTTEPPVDWSFQEVLLAEQFRLYPATTDGMIAGLEALDKDEEYQPPPFEDWQKSQQKRTPDNSYRYNAWESVDDHQNYWSNDPEGFRWLCALAVNARPDWALTIAIGQAIGVAVTHDRLLQLSRIPWLATNQPDNGLRLELLRLLTKEEERAARQAVADELEQVKEQVADSFSASEWAASHALQQFALQPRAKANKQLLSQLLNAGLLTSEQEAELDFIVKERIGKGDEPLTAHENLNAWLKWEAPSPQLRLYRWLAMGLTALAVALLAYGGWYNNQDHNTQPTNGLYQAVHQIDSAQLIHNQAVAYLQGLDSTATTPALITEQFDSVMWAKGKLEQAIALRQPDAYLLADSNLTSLHYQFAALLLNSAHAILSKDTAYLAVLQAAYNGFNDLAANTQLRNQHHLNALHGSGIAAWYLQKNDDTRAALLDTARMHYDSLLFYTDSTYFDSLRAEMPINLETLLRRFRPRRYLNALLLDAQNEQPIRNALLQLDNKQLRTNNKGIAHYDFGEQLPEINGKGQLKLSIKADGYGQKTYLLELFTTNNQWDTLLLEKGIGKISTGRVLDRETKQPIATAAVQAMDANLVANNNLSSLPVQRTDSKGRYTVSSLRTSRQIQARIIAEGYRDTIVRLRALEELPDVYLQPIEVVVQVNIDRDRDGVPDNTDQCPNTPQGAKVDDKGCEIPPPPLAFTPPEMIRIAGGTFTMGCKNTDRDGECYDREKPAHPVSLNTYYMGKTEVTVGEYLAFADETGDNYPEWLEEGNDYHVETGSDTYYKNKGNSRDAINLPIVGVSHNNAVAYCKWLSQKTGQQYRLPTEAEWEYAARGGEQGEKDNFLYSGSNTIDEVAWYSSNSDSRTHTVAGKKPNQLGLYDMSGNVREWCADWYGAYEDGAQENPRGVDTGTYRVFRGGSWFIDPADVRCAFRLYNTPGYRDVSIGFRLSRAGR